MINVELQCQMLRKHVRQDEIAYQIKRSGPYVTTRIHGHKPWTIQEVYTICDMLEIPYTEIPRFFPKEDKKK